VRAEPWAFGKSFAGSGLWKRGGGFGCGGSSIHRTEPGSGEEARGRWIGNGGTGGRGGAGKKIRAGSTQGVGRTVRSKSPGLGREGEEAAGSWGKTELC
jgi:hypothetical protein